MESGGDLLLGNGSLLHSFHVRHTGIQGGEQVGRIEKPERRLRNLQTSQISVVADSTRLERLPSVVRRRTAAKGDSTFVVRRCNQCSRGN